MSGLLTDAEKAAMIPMVQSALDVSLPQYRATIGEDSSGHETETYSFLANVPCNIVKPNAGQLQVYADVIGSQRAVILRVMQTQDVVQNDRFVYDGLNWRVHGYIDAESYTVTKELLIITIAGILF